MTRFTGRLVIVFCAVTVSQVVPEEILAERRALQKFDRWVAEQSEISEYRHLKSWAASLGVSTAGLFREAFAPRPNDVTGYHERLFGAGREIFRSKGINFANREGIRLICHATQLPLESEAALSAFTSATEYLSVTEGLYIADQRRFPQINLMIRSLSRDLSNNLANPGRASLDPKNVPGDFSRPSIEGMRTAYPEVITARGVLNALIAHWQDRESWFPYRDEKLLSESSVAKIEKALAHWVAASVFMSPNYATFFHHAEGFAEAKKAAAKDQIAWIAQYLLDRRVEFPEFSENQGKFFSRKFF